MTKRYAIKYGDTEIVNGVSQNIEIGFWYTRAFDREHALDKFYESDPDSGYTPFEICVADPEVDRHRWIWHKV